MNAILAVLLLGFTTLESKTLKRWNLLASLLLLKKTPPQAL